MTRTTSLAVTSPGIEPMALWRTMATALRAPEQYRFTVNPTSIHAEMGQGLDALMWLDHAHDLTLVPEGGCDTYCEPDCSAYWCYVPSHYLMANFDTAYGATDPCGCHSGGIHIRLLREVGNWLDAQGATWRWEDESGEGWHHEAGWGTLGDPREACPQHRSLPAPPVAKTVAKAGA